MVLNVSIFSAKILADRIFTIVLQFDGKSKEDTPYQIVNKKLPKHIFSTWRKIVLKMFIFQNKNEKFQIFGVKYSLNQLKFEIFSPI